jgi:hypothetical protein
MDTLYMQKIIFTVVMIGPRSQYLTISSHYNFSEVKARAPMFRMPGP